jgi:hypothetical protein
MWERPWCRDSNAGGARLCRATNIWYIPAVADRRYSLEAFLFRYRRAFARTFPFVLGASHLNRNAERAIITPMPLVAGQPFPITTVVADKNLGLGLLLNPSHVAFWKWTCGECAGFQEFQVNFYAFLALAVGHWDMA